MNTQEYDKRRYHLYKLVEENGLYFPYYRLICEQEVLKQMEKNNDKDMENGNQPR
jgi:hypothetical protein